MRLKFSFPLALLTVVAVSAGTGWALSGALGAGRVPPVSIRPPAAPAAAKRRPSVGLAALRRGWSYLAAARGRELTVYRHRGSERVVARLGNPTPFGMPLTLLVKHARRDWLEAFLPTRPNGSIGWVRRRAVRLISTPWSLTVHLRAHRLVVSRAGRQIRVLRVAVGKASTPTPVGTFFITDLLKQPDPAGAYGPYAYGTSAHSSVLRHFGAGGDGQIGLHGTDQPWVIGTSVTHGCIRVSDAAITWLAKRLPLGTPLRTERR